MFCLSTNSTSQSTHFLTPLNNTNDLHTFLSLFFVLRNAVHENITKLSVNWFEIIKLFPITFLEICSYLVISSITEHKQQKAMHNCVNRYLLRSCNNFLEFIKFFNLNFCNLIEGRILYKDLLRPPWCLTLKVNCQR